MALVRFLKLLLLSYVALAVTNAVLRDRRGLRRNLSLGHRKNF
jgi:hypothetical protein